MKIKISHHMRISWVPIFMVPICVTPSQPEVGTQ